ncbi:MAG: tryptophan halogenase [Pirellulaceae bacterium]|jgi:tryptophan halogenase
MTQPIQDVLVVGAGSAGLLAALTIERLPANIKVRIVRSSNVSVIGVGESTTAALPLYLHGPLGIDRAEFYREVRPSWKLGIRFEWGAKDVPHFYYPFDSRLDHKRDNLPRPEAYFCTNDLSDFTPYACLMERGCAPLYQHQGRLVVDEGFGYHLDNNKFIAYLESLASRRGIDIIEGEVNDVQLDESGNLKPLKLKDGQELKADLYVDCSGFRSLLLGKTLEDKYTSYNDVLFCDRAIVGSFQRGGKVLPYTTAETMEHGWCWRIELLDRVTRGYVFSSQFCDEEEAGRELREKNPELLDAELRTLKFPSGRYENFWTKNVVAIGNASGFVEPLEATALHLVSEQLRLVCQGIMDCEMRNQPAMQRLQNGRFRAMWDDVRDFLAMHFKFNQHCDSEFWKHCRANTNLGGAEEVVQFYKQVGPSIWLKKLLPNDSMFGYSGYMNMILGQRLPTDWSPSFPPPVLQNWNSWRDQIRMRHANMPTTRQALDHIHSPQWQWPVSKRI